MYKSFFNPYRILLLSMVLAMLACSSDSPEGTVAAQKIEIPGLSCDTREDSLGNPRSTLYVIFEENKIKVAELYACSEINPADYAQYHIPSEAIESQGGWWAGAGDYYYLAQEEDKFVIYHGSIFEESTTDNYNYRPIATLSPTGELELKEE